MSLFFGKQPAGNVYVDLFNLLYDKKRGKYLRDERDLLISDYLLDRLEDIVNIMILDQQNPPTTVAQNTTIPIPIPIPNPNPYPTPNTTPVSSRPSSAQQVSPITNTQNPQADATSDTFFDAQSTASDASFETVDSYSTRTSPKGQLKRKKPTNKKQLSKRAKLGMALKNLFRAFVPASDNTQTNIDNNSYYSASDNQSLYSATSLRSAPDKQSLRSASIAPPKDVDMQSALDYDLASLFDEDKLLESYQIESINLNEKRTVYVKISKDTTERQLTVRDIIKYFFTQRVDDKKDKEFNKALEATSVTLEALNKFDSFFRTSTSFTYFIDKKIELHVDETSRLCELCLLVLDCVILKPEDLEANYASFITLSDEPNMFMRRNITSELSLFLLFKLNSFAEPNDYIDDNMAAMLSEMTTSFSDPDPLSLYAFLNPWFTRKLLFAMEYSTKLLDYLPDTVKTVYEDQIETWLNKTQFFKASALVDHKTAGADNFEDKKFVRFFLSDATASDFNYEVYEVQKWLSRAIGMLHALSTVTSYKMDPSVLATIFPDKKPKPVEQRAFEIYFSCCAQNALDNKDVTQIFTVKPLTDRARDLLYTFYELDPSITYDTEKLELLAIKMLDYKASDTEAFYEHAQLFLSKEFTYVGIDPEKDGAEWVAPIRLILLNIIVKRYPLFTNNEDLFKYEESKAKITRLGAKNIVDKKTFSSRIIK